MKAEDLKLEELIDISEGRLDLHGRRLVIHSINAFAQLRRDLMEMLGPEQTRRVFTRFGYFWGNADAAAMARIFKWDNLTEWLKAGPRMHALQGVTKVVTESLRFDEGAGTFRMEVVWHDSGEAEEHVVEFGKSEVPVCWMLAGYASGYASFCLRKDVFFIEDKCRAKGNRTCTAVGKDRDSWGDALEPHRPYFLAEDIQGKVRSLTRELARKTRQLAEQRKKLDLFESKDRPMVVEVHSASFRRVLELAERVARHDSSVLITGESGVGKEVLARYLHGLSKRSKGPFVGVNCGALPETLLETELFGHKAGAFTGASEDRVGLFETAQKGTIFLDEVAEISLGMQVKLLRVLQEREIRRVGESKARKIDVRVLAATNRDMAEAVENGSFREDLYYRLGVIEMEVPSLRDRKEDLLPLVRYFVEELSKRLGLRKLRLDSTCLDALQAYAWPGNVRELENALERAAIMCQEGVIREDDLPPSVLRGAPTTGTASAQAGRTLADVERDHIQAVLSATNGNRTHAARILGISPTTLWRKLKSSEG